MLCDALSVCVDCCACCSQNIIPHTLLGAELVRADFEFSEQNVPAGVYEQKIGEPDAIVFPAGRPAMLRAHRTMTDSDPTERSRDVDDR